MQNDQVKNQAVRDVLEKVWQSAEANRIAARGRKFLSDDLPVDVTPIALELAQLAGIDASFVRSIAEMRTIDDAWGVCHRMAKAKAGAWLFPATPQQYLWFVLSKYLYSAAQGREWNDVIRGSVSEESYWFPLDKPEGEVRSIRKPIIPGIGRSAVFYPDGTMAPLP